MDLHLKLAEFRFKSALTIFFLVNFAIVTSALSYTKINSNRVFLGTPAKYPRRLVSDFMTPNPITLTSDTSVNDAIAVLLKNKISGAPVVDSKFRIDKKFKPVGVVSSSDFLPREDSGVLLTIETKEVPSEVMDECTDAAKKVFGQKVQDIMTPNPMTIKQSETMRKASNVMSKFNLHRLLVIDEFGALVGILTRSDIMRDLLMVSNLLAPVDEVLEDANLDHAFPSEEDIQESHEEFAKVRTELNAMRKEDTRTKPGSKRGIRSHQWNFV